MLTTSRLIQLLPFIKWASVFKAAGLNASTMRGAMKNRRPLTEDESEAIERALEQHGIHVSDVEQGNLFE